MTTPETAFDITQYPERLACKAMPELNEGRVSVEIMDWDGNLGVHEVPTDAIQRLNMPRLSPNVPNLIRAPFEQAIGLCLLACRVLNHNEDVVSVELPTEPPSTFVVRDGQVAQRM